MIPLLRVCGQLASSGIAEGLSRKDALHRCLMEIAKRSDVDEWLRNNPGHAPDETGFGGISAKKLIEMMPSLGLAWAESGFPSVEIGHRLAASFVCTSVPKEHADGVRPPWRCFLLRAPLELLPEFGSALVLFPRDDEVARPIFWYRFGVRFFGITYEDTLGSFAYPNLEKEFIYQAPETDEVRFLARQNAMFGRLLVGTCIEMDRPNPIVESNRGTSGSKGKRRGDPTNWTIKLTRPVRVDMRDAVRSYLRGERHGAMRTQHVVRGHHKRQVCGSGLQDRKWIHVEPYWRGDPDAPIAVRAHKLDGMEETA